MNQVIDNPFPEATMHCFHCCEPLIDEKTNFHCQECEHDYCDVCFAFMGRFPDDIMVKPGMKEHVTQYEKHMILFERMTYKGILDVTCGFCLLGVQQDGYIDKKEGLVTKF